ncbi:4'-phosphopantetheinyl transferase superfamily protein [Ideonella sp.]|uniref:4'-phosphopantetheinyl transferase family protein n=1 Tax=Ideonella sp. TaxID=1929293 RepID=UPI0035B0F2CF
MPHAHLRLASTIRCQSLDAPAPFEVWCAELDRWPTPTELGWLSADEHRRARAFAFERDRRRFLTAHVALRAVLAGHLGVAASALEFERGEFGKPRLRSSGLQFNLSHGEDLALIALTGADTGVGVDVEQPRPVNDLRALAQALFTENEQRQVFAETGAGVTRAFFTCWTRKEACLKAVGWGLSVEPASIDVGATADPVELLVRSGERVARVVVRSLPPSHGAIVALAQAAPSVNTIALSGRPWRQPSISSIGAS